MNLNSLGIVPSDQVKERNIKMMFWGPTGSRKTETVLRYFPHVLLIDAEGNSDQCVNDPEIPLFLRAKTKDVRKALQIIDAVASGQVKFPDGSPVETVAWDSVSVVWSVQQEVASNLAERRAARKNISTDDATTTPIDWVTAKRPLKHVYTRLSNSPIRFLILIAREKDLYDETEKKGDVPTKKIGFQPDIMKGLDYDVNLALHFHQADKKGNWDFDVTKVQGKLKTIFPIGSTISGFPIKELLDYSRGLEPSAGSDEDEVEVGLDVAIAEEIASIQHTFTGLLEYAAKLGMTKEVAGATLKAAGFEKFNSANFTKMVLALNAAAKPMPEPIAE